MKILLEAIDVQCKRNTNGNTVNGDGAKGPVPMAICWRSGVYQVEQILETWTYRSKWWTNKEETREYMLLITTNGVMEIYHGTEGWMLSRVYD